MRFLVRIYRHVESYSAMVPDLPGCIAAGDSVEEVQKLMAEAMALHLDMMRRSREKVPKPTRHSDFDEEDADEDELITWIAVKKHKAAAREGV